MATYTYRCFDRLSMQELGQLPLYGVSFSSKLKDIGQLRGNVAKDAKLAFSPEPLTTRIVVDRDGTPVWDGIVTSYGFKASSPDRSIAAQEYQWILKKIRIGFTYTYVGWDQTLLAKNLLDYAEGFGPLYLTVDSVTSGVLRTQEYKHEQAKDIWTAIVDLSSLYNGFDFAFRPYYDSSLNLQEEVAFGYPRLGQQYRDTAWTYEYPGNLLDYELDVDGSSTANGVLGTSTDASNANILSWQGDPTLYPYYGWLQDVQSFQDAKTQDELDARTQAEMLARRLPIATYKCWLRPDTWPELGSAAVGDDVRLRLTSPRHPANEDGSPGFDSFLRLIAVDVTAPNLGSSEQITLSFAPILADTNVVIHEPTLPAFLGNLQKRVERLEVNQP